MRTSPDFYRQKDGSIIAFSQSVKPEGELILGYDYDKQTWVTEGKEEVKKYLKENKKIKLINESN